MKRKKKEYRHFEKLFSEASLTKPAAPESSIPFPCEPSFPDHFEDLNTIVPNPSALSSGLAMTTLSPPNHPHLEEFS